jgi:MFS family permease
VTATATRPPPAGPRRPGGLLRRRDFRLLWLAETTSQLGSTMTGVALPLIAVTALDATAFQAAVLYAATWIPWLLIGLPAGAWVDRLPRRPVMVACDLACAALYVSVPVTAWLGGLTIAHLLAVALGGGVATVFAQTAQYAYLPSLLEPARLDEGNATLAGTDSATRVAGPGLAGLLIQAAGAVSAVLLDAVTFVVSALCLSAIRFRESPGPAGRARRGGIRREIADGIRFVARDPYLRALTVFGAVANLGLVGYQSILVVFLVREVGVGAGAVGGLVAAVSCGGLLGAVIAGPVARRLGTARATLWLNGGTLPFGLLIPLTGGGTRLAAFVAGGAILGVGVVVGNVVKSAFRQRYTPAHLLGRVVVSMQFLNYGTIPIGALTAGALAGTVGVRPAMWIITGVLAPAGLILLCSPLRRLRDLPEHLPEHHPAA